MSEIVFSDSMMVKVLDYYFDAEKMDPRWYKTVAYWCLNSKYRAVKRLDLYLKEQLDNPSSGLVTEALALRAQYDDPDELVVAMLKLVNERMQYASDNSIWGSDEYWATAKESWEKRWDDCDGQNGLLYHLLRLAGIPAFVLFSVIGDTVDGGHFWVLYYSTKENKLYSLDCTYYSDERSLKDRKAFVLTDQRYKEIWYLFNDLGIWRT